MNRLAGLDHATSGSITVEGLNLVTLDQGQLAQYRQHTVGMVFQSFNFVPTMTLTENVELPMRFTGSSVGSGMPASKRRSAKLG